MSGDDSAWIEVRAQKMDWTQLSVMLMPDDCSSQFVQISFPGGTTMTQAKADGSFEFSNLAPGEYRIAITSNSSTLQDYYTKAVNLDGKDVAASGFSVSGGSYSLQVVVGADGGTIEGTVVDVKGQPVPEATIVGAPNGERRQRFDVFGVAGSDAQGHFQLRGLVPGEYTVFGWSTLRATFAIRKFSRPTMIAAKG